MVCYVYHEGEGGKGPNEVASLLSNYIETYILCDPQIKKLKIFADNSAGQNKNYAIVRFIMKLANLTVLNYSTQLGATHSCHVIEISL